MLISRSERNEDCMVRGDEKGWCLEPGPSEREEWCCAAG